MSISNDKYLSFIIFYAHPDYLMGISSVGYFPVLSRDSLTNFQVPLNVGKISLNRQNFIHTYVRYSLRILTCHAGIWMGICMSVQPYVCQYVQTSVCPYVHYYICMSVIMFVHSLVCVYISVLCYF